MAKATKTLPQPERENAQRKYRVSTDRRPFWDGKQTEQGDVISAAPDHPAIIAMLDRGWILEAADAS